MSLFFSWTALFLLSLTAAQNITQTTSFSFSPTPVSTSVPSPTAPLDSIVPGQGNYPPVQALCAGGANVPFCPGILLQDVQLSGIFSDSKTFVDKPTVGTLNETLSAWDALGGNVTVGEVETFVEQYFKGEGLELSQVQLQNFVEDPAILGNIADPVFKAWVKVVNGYWTLLARETNQSALCNGNCVSSLIPLNHSMIVPGGRYREIYYWDSFWVLEGLLKSELYDYAWDLLQNFMDLIDIYGFLPNGGRKYYLNRSQPPVFVQMIDAYIKTTNNVTILERALPVASAELQWWANNRTSNFTSPFTNQSRIITQYSVTNSAPRPEGYAEDFETVMGASPALNETEQAELYSQLASGAESGWDYSSRWCEQPLLNTTDNNPALRTLNIKSIIPVDLLSLMAGDHALLANMYELYANNTGSEKYTDNEKKSKRDGQSGDDTASKVAYHRQMAQAYRDSILDLCWDSEKSWFYDFNMTSSSRSDVFHPGGAWPLWQNITPSEIAGNESAALSFVSGFRFLLGHYSGVPSVATLLFTGLNWDFPNAWPPHAYTSIKAFETLGRMLPNATVLSNLTIPFDSVTKNQLGLSESELQPQPQSTIGNVSLNTETSQDKPWPLALSIEFANRYLDAAFCSWYSTGGEISGLLTQLPLSDLNATGTYTAGQAGVMFEKFNVTDTDAAGGGGEYTVQIGFGWTNGVALWAAGEYGQYIPAPTCPLIPILEVNATSGSNTSDSSVYNATDEDRGSTASDTAKPASLFVGYRIPRK
ncbi:alpha,alpha-trehalase [Cryptococcus deuterogattii R265]|uniref:alpha,alpha-trehalase n=1 Tax=Cryptococcus deuterogattii (strain R265) TaxID=294750 RepID=UPI0019370A08|nr:alpha,alpha-trehalase [Cryptococcus deuterogattii R265]